MVLVAEFCLATNERVGFLTISSLCLFACPSSMRLNVFIMGKATRARRV